MQQFEAESSSSSITSAALDPIFHLGQVQINTMA